MNRPTTTTPIPADHRTTGEALPHSGWRVASGLFLIACVTAIGAMSAAAATAAVNATPPAVPANLEVPQGNRMFHLAHALGTQNYLCLPRTSGSGLAWTFIGPQATLFDAELEQVMTHFLSVNPVENVARAT